MRISINDALPPNTEDVWVIDIEDYAAGWWDSNTRRWYPSVDMLDAEDEWGAAEIEFYFDVKLWKAIERIGE